MNTSNLFNLKQFMGRIVVAMLMLTTLAACDSSSAVGGLDGTEDSLGETVSLLAADLGLNAQESAALSASFAKFGDLDGDSDREPGFLWRVAAELQATLTDEQKARLFERLEDAGNRRRGGGANGGIQGRRPGQGGPGMNGNEGRRGNALQRLELTDDQQEAIAAIREEFKPQIEAILEQRDTLTREEIKEQLDAIREEVKTRIEGVLTDEQKAQLEEWKAEAELRQAEREAAREVAREEAKLVMIEVLGLTDDQVNALEELRESAEAQREAIRELIESGADRDAVQAEVEAQRAAHQEAMASILDDTQLEITMIHQVLSQRMKNRKGKGGQGGNGQNRPGGFGGPGFGGQNGVVNG